MHKAVDRNNGTVPMDIIKYLLSFLYDDLHRLVAPIPMGLYNHVDM